MSHRELRARCKALVAALDIPRPLDLDELGRSIGARRDRPIRLMPRSMAGLPSGLTIPRAHSDLVFYEKDTTAVHQAVIVLHEYAHILLGHTDTPDSDDLALILDELDPGLISRVLGNEQIVGQAVARTHFSPVKEQEAELLACLIHQAATKSRLSQRCSGGVDNAIVDRVGRTLEPWESRDG